MEKRLIKLLLIFVLLISSVQAKEVNLSSKNYILYNLNDNEVIDSKNENDRVSVASLTKIMTVIVAIENIKDYNAKVTISNDMISGIARDVVKVGFKKGEVVTYDDLLYGSILKSGADAVNALAISTSKSMDSFIDKMNAKVKELGLKNTHFSNVVGLYDKDNYSSAYDISKILLYALKNEKFKEVFSTKEYKLTNGVVVSRTIDYYNKKLNENLSFIKGAKTGYISEAGYCLATIATLNDIDYLFVSLGSDKSPKHIEDHIKEYKYFKDNYGYHDLITPYDKIVTLNTKYSYENSIDIYYDKTIQKYLKNDFDKNEVSIIYNGMNTISYFTPKNSKIGNVTIIYKGEVLDIYDVYNNSNLTLNIHSFFKDYENVFILIVFFIFLIVYLFICVKNRLQTNLEVDNKDIKF